MRAHAIGGRFATLRRLDMATTIYGALDDGVETLFGDSVAGIKDTGMRVHIEFEYAAPREVDLLFGADWSSSVMNVSARSRWQA